MVSKENNPWIAAKQVHIFAILSGREIIEIMQAAAIVNAIEIVSSTVETEEFLLHPHSRKSSNGVSVPPTPTGQSKVRKVQVYQPPPLLHTTTVFAFGSMIVLLTSVWMPLGLILVWVVARLQNYIFRVNDDPSARRVLLKEFQRHDTLTAPFRHIPRGMTVEETYWVNRRYVS